MIKVLVTCSFIILAGFLQRNKIPKYTAQIAFSSKIPVRIQKMFLRFTGKKNTKKNTKKMKS